jgi:nucleoside triphosphate diphosphatase
MAKPIDEVLKVMARLRSPKGGCPWDLEQDHITLRYHAVEEVYELMDAIEAGDDHEMVEELGDLLLQIVFHCQLGSERKAFDFDTVCRRLVDKLVRRHPHVFGTLDVKQVEAVLSNWEKIKRAEKVGTRHERPSVFDGIPRHLPALLKAEKLVKKARKAKLMSGAAKRTSASSRRRLQTSRGGIAKALFELAAQAQAGGWSAEELLRSEVTKRERVLRKVEAKKTGT